MEKWYLARLITLRRRFKSGTRYHEKRLRRLVARKSYDSENQAARGWYIGYTADLRKRFLEHNSGKGGQTTRRGREWKLIYCEAYLLKEDAIGREKFLKSGSGRKYLKKQMANYLTN